MGIAHKTAWRLVRRGQLPKEFRSIRFGTNTIRIIENESEGLPSPRASVIYARINLRSEESELQEQIRICSEFCFGRGWQIERIVSERAPGFGPKRRRLHALLGAPPGKLVVARASVLSRFDLTVTELLLRNLGCELTVVNQEMEREGKGGALEDLTDAISSTCNLHYGPKRGRALVDDLNRLVARRS